jgi:Protein of unknown function (DUF1579)
MEMPRPGDAHETLARFAGEWTIVETMHPSPWDQKGGEASAHAEYRIACDGFFLVCDYRQERGGRVTYRAHGVYGWDAPKHKLTMHWFDSMGMDPGAPALGEWEGDALTFQHQTAMGHSRYVYGWESEDRFTLAIDHSRDGTQWVRFLDSVCTRVG